MILGAFHGRRNKAKYERGKLDKENWKELEQISPRTIAYLYAYARVRVGGQPH